MSITSESSSSSYNMINYSCFAEELFKKLSTSSIQQIELAQKFIDSIVLANFSLVLFHFCNMID